MENEDHAEETVELDDARDDGPRWAHLEEEPIRNSRVDRVACWCRRVVGLIVWCFVVFIFSQLWTVAWQMRSLNLLGVCVLVTASLLYVFYKRYQQIRGSGLSGVELVRALAVDDTRATRLQGVSRKARALCVDFKYDPDRTFRERSPGCGFELYPPPPAPAPPPPYGDDSSRPSSAVDGEEDRKGASSWRRRRVRWPWGLRAGARGGGRGRGDASSSGQGGAAAEADEDTPITQQEGDDAADADQPALARPSAPPPPDLEAGGGGGGQVIRASELSLSCTVCLFEYYKDEAVTLLPCSHLYHTECIDIWMRDHTDCPYCRADMNSWSASGGGGGGSVNRASLGAASGGSGINSSPAQTNAAAAAAAALSPAAAAPAAPTAAAGGVPS